MNREPRVLVAGYGQMGHALQALLGGRAALEVWGITPANTTPTPEVIAAAVRADFLLLCVPTLAHGAVVAALKERLPSGTGVLSIAKGLDDAGRTAADILGDWRGRGPWGVLGGPMIADEIVKGRPAFAEFGTADGDFHARVTTLFRGSGLALTHSQDARAVSWCGVLKNVYAPLVGIADGLGWGDNARGHLVMAALGEMQRLLPVLAGTQASVYGDAGLADFVTTVTSPSSHHHALGVRVGRGDFADMQCEGVNSLAVLDARPRFDPAGFPLFAAARGLVHAPAGVASALRVWLAGTA